MTINDLEKATSVADACADLIEAGFTPFIQHLVVKDKYWNDDRFSWLLVSDCVLRMEGFSWDQDQECLFAINNYIPVYATVTELLKGEKPSVK